MSSFALGLSGIGIMFVLLFAYVFGNSIDIPGSSYREFLIAGIFAQTVMFGATFTGAGIAEDMQKGIIDRFKSLPMSRSDCRCSPESTGCAFAPEAVPPAGAPPGGRRPPPASPTRPPPRGPRPHQPRRSPQRTPSREQQRRW